MPSQWHLWRDEETSANEVTQRETGEISTQLARRAKRVRLLGQLLDNSIPIPGTNSRIGLDPVIGLIPGVGDLIGGLLSGYIILEAARLIRMLTNVGIDTLVGVIPALGDLFDAAWKANMRNVVLLQSHLVTSDESARNQGSVLTAS